MPSHPAPRRLPFLSSREVTDRVADRTLGLLTQEQVAVDRLLMSLHPETARIECETFLHLARLDRESTAVETHAERFARLFGTPTV